MLTRISAEDRARDHIAGKPAPAEGYRLAHSTPVVVATGWYFDYVIVCDVDIPEAEQEKFAGAYGFLVDRESGSVSEISHSQWVDLGLAINPDPYGGKEPWL